MSENSNERSKLNKIDILVLNNGWNDRNESVIVNIGKNCEKYMTLHNLSSSKYTLYNRIVSVVIIFFNSGLSIQTIFGDSSDKCNNNNGLVITQNIFIYIVTLLSVINNFLKFEKFSTKHKYSSIKFSELYHNIQKIMCAYRKDRPNAVKYISDAFKKYDNLIMESPTIPSNIMKSTGPITISVLDNSITETPCVVNINTIPTIPTITQDDSHLNVIQSMFSITGDLCENDNITLSDVQQYARTHALQRQGNYEMDRLFRTAEEND